MVANKPILPYCYPITNKTTELKKKILSEKNKIYFRDREGNYFPMFIPQEITIRETDK